ncbi:MAG: hypothetical protein ABIL39_00895 [candidate division WOR-3 bacterium]
MPQTVKKVWRISLYILISTGVFFRLAQYFYNRSLTEGEAPLALNIITRSYSELFKPLDYVQAAPIGFLYIEKSLVNLLGNNEYALRLFPLITGILTIFLFYAILKLMGDSRLLIFALGLFILNDHLIYFSSEVKPYASDVFWGLLLVLITLRACQNGLKISILLSWGILGIIIHWFSFPSVFIFLGSGLVLLFCALQTRRHNVLIVILVMGLLGIISLLLNYALSLRHYLIHTELRAFWQESFVPLPFTWKDFYRFFYLLGRILKNPGGFSLYEIIPTAFFFVVGAIYLFRKNKIYFGEFSLPLLITILASMGQLYPFEGRLLLFLVPALMIFVAQGISEVFVLIKENNRTIAVMFALLLYLYPVGLSFFHVFKPRAPEELRPVLEYLLENKREGDIVYLYYGSVNAFRYYQTRFPDLNISYITGIEARHNWTQYYYDIQRLHGSKRVWFVFSHIATHLGVNEEKLFLTYLDLLGKRVDGFVAPGAAAYLYDLSF